LVDVPALPAVSVPVLADFAGALAARVGAFVAVLVACAAAGEPLVDLADERLARALAGDLAAVRFTGSSVAGRALVAAT
jgi:hypothetical protein